MKISREIGLIYASSEFLKFLNVSCELAEWRWKEFD
ncbi:MAG: hypothetical protein JWN92_2449 [Candidatus Acidoferrum typicum]|nr:hypothetical protein [Candidatus Acidoferrum typicum]